MNTYKISVDGPFIATPNQEGLGVQVGCSISDTIRINAESKSEAIELALATSVKGSKVRQCRKVKYRG